MIHIGQQVHARQECKCSRAGVFKRLRVSVHTLRLQLFNLRSDEKQRDILAAVHISVWADSLPGPVHTARNVHHACSPHQACSSLF